MKAIHVVLFSAALALGGPVQAQNTATTTDAKAAAAQSKLDRDSEKFFTEAAIGGMAEVQLGRLASEKAMSPEVKGFGEMMVKDHTNANEQLMTLAKQHAVTVPGELDKKHQAAKDKLEKKQGADFDKAYMDQMVKDHKKTIDLFEDYAKKGKLEDVKAFAQSTLPKLKEHLQHAQKIEKALK